MELFNSTTLHKLFGIDLDNNFVYPNIFLILLLSQDLTMKFSQLEENSAAATMVNNIFNWIFSPSEASRKFVEMVDRSSETNPTVFQNLQLLLQIHYHLVSKSNSKLKFEDRFTTANKSTKIKAKIFNKTRSHVYTIKDGAIFENEDHNDSFSWTLDAKLFIHGSQESIVILKDGKSCLSLKTNKQQNSNKETAQENALQLTLNNSETPWDVRECKWVLKTGVDSDLLAFTLTSMCDLYYTLNGRFKSKEDYQMIFPDLCSCNMHLKYILERTSYKCNTCDTGGYFCQTCIDHCHKGHKVTKYDITNGYCGCRFMGHCEIASGCTAKFNRDFKNHIMYRCNECPDDKKNIVLCLACKKHHEQDCKHENFEKVTDGDVCGCGCITSRTRIIACGSQYTYTRPIDSYNSNNLANRDEDEEDEDSD